MTCSGDAGVTRRVREAAGEPGAELRQVPVQLRRQLAERPQAGRHRQRIARQRAGLVDGARRRDELHQIGASAVGADRQAAADDLAETGEIRLDAEDLLRAAGRSAESRDHLVEDEQRAVADRQIAQAGEEAIARRDDADVAGDRLDDDGGDLIAIPRRRAPRPTPGRCSVASSVSAAAAAGTPGLVGTPSVSAPDPACDEESVGVAVIAALRT